MSEPDRPAPVIVTAEIGPADLAWLERLRREHFPADRNQVPAHITMFHHLPPSLLDELDSRLRGEARSTVRLAATIGDPMLLGHGVALRVRCAALDAIRERLAEAFMGMLTPQDVAAWRSHITIQNKVEPAVARRLHATLVEAFPRPRSLHITGFATFHYRGGPWESIARYRFAG